MFYALRHIWNRSFSLVMAMFGSYVEVLKIPIRDWYSGNIIHFIFGIQKSAWKQMSSGNIEFLLHFLYVNKQMLFFLPEISRTENIILKSKVWSGNIIWHSVTRKDILDIRIYHVYYKRQLFLEHLKNKQIKNMWKLYSHGFRVCISFRFFIYWHRFWPNIV